MRSVSTTRETLRSLDGSGRDWLYGQTAAGGDQAETLGGLRNLGGTCGNCHDSYRVDDE